MRILLSLLILGSLAVCGQAQARWETDHMMGPRNIEVFLKFPNSDARRSFKPSYMRFGETPYLVANQKIPVLGFGPAFQNMQQVLIGFSKVEQKGSESQVVPDHKSLLAFLRNIHDEEFYFDQIEIDASKGKIAFKIGLFDVNSILCVRYRYFDADPKISPKQREKSVFLKGSTIMDAIVRETAFPETGDCEIKPLK